MTNNGYQGILPNQILFQKSWRMNKASQSKIIIFYRKKQSTLASRVVCGCQILKLNPSDNLPSYFSLSN